MEECRKIETVEGGLGYTETYDSTTLVPTSGSNGIDIHMMKSTEYGLMAILAVSGYGNHTTSGFIESTTGNNTGVIIHSKVNHLVAAGHLTVQNGRDGRYFDEYTDIESAKRGDAIGSSTTKNPGCAGWRGGRKDLLNLATPVLFRGGGSGGLFYYGNGYIDFRLYSRAVAVVGEGL